MTDRAQISTNIDPNVRQMLDRLAGQDVRTLKGELEWLIRRECERRGLPVDLDGQECDDDA